jgi:hypothetical protein
MRVYLAARYSRKNEIASLIPLLGKHGISVGSRWLHETLSPSTSLAEVSPEFCKDTAEADLEDIEECDTLVFFAEDPLIGTPRGGRHVEFGFALGIGKRIVVIGPERENIFHFLPGVTMYESLAQFLSQEGRRTDNA